MRIPATTAPLCSHLGCSLLGLGCYLTPDAAQAEDILCPEHAAQAGYCSVCGVWAADQAGFALAPLCTDCLEAIDELNPGW